MVELLGSAFSEEEEERAELATGAAPVGPLEGVLVEDREGATGGEASTGSGEGLLEGALDDEEADDEATSEEGGWVNLSAWPVLLGLGEEGAVGAKLLSAGSALAVSDRPLAFRASPEGFSFGKEGTLGALLLMCLSALTSEGIFAPLLLACPLLMAAAQEEEEEEARPSLVNLVSSSEADSVESSACEPVPDLPPCTATRTVMRGIGLLRRQDTMDASRKKRKGIVHFEPTSKAVNLEQQMRTPVSQNDVL